MLRHKTERYPIPEQIFSKETGQTYNRGQRVVATKDIGHLPGDTISGLHAKKGDVLEVWALGYLDKYPIGVAQLSDSAVIFGVSEDDIAVI